MRIFISACALNYHTFVQILLSIGVRQRRIAKGKIDDEKELLECSGSRDVNSEKSCTKSLTITLRRVMGKLTPFYYYYDEDRLAKLSKVYVRSEEKAVLKEGEMFINRER